ncbi:MAG: aquaporin [Pseudomonadota bacterium]
MTPLPRRLFAEFLGTALLLATVVGSGVMGMELSGGNRGVALLANAGATAAALYVLIVLLGPVSGAHMNPAVSLVARLRGELDARTLAGYVLAQVAGAVAGVALAHLMFGLDVVQWGDHARTGASQWLSEAVATAGLVLTIVLGLRHRAAAVPALVAAYIFAAYWFTASTSFANPAVTLARSITRTFAGIRPEDVPGFVIAQLAGALLGLAVARALAGDDRRVDRPQ